MVMFGSVCSGIEAASVAWNPLGWKAAWLSEIESFPCAVLQHHYPDVPNLGDMTKIAHLIRDGFVPAPDVFCGGTPCQAFSIAGLRNSLDDARGNLSLVFCEIADEIDKRRAATGLLPSVIFWENVPGVLSTSDNAFGCFLAGLAGEDDPLVPPGGKWTDAGCVYGPQRTVAWRVTDAQYFGVAQRRRRVFVVASAREGFDPTEVLFEFDGVRRDSPPSRQAGQETAGTLASRTDGGGFPGTDEACSGYVQQVVGTLQANGKAAGSATQQDAEAGLLVPTAFSSKDYGGDANAGVPPAIAYSIRTANTSSNGWGIQEELTHTLDCTAGPAVAFCREVAQTITSNYGKQVDNSDTALGPNVVCVTGEITHTLKAEGFDASEDGTGRGQPIVPSMAFAQNTRDEVRLLGGDGEIVGALAAQPGMKQTTYVAPGGMAVRRLTPVECARLQGFPDDYLGQVIIRGKPAADGPMYKALGNSWAVPNVFWIGARIDAALRLRGIV